MSGWQKKSSDGNSENHHVEESGFQVQAASTSAQVTNAAFCYPQWAIVFGWSISPLYFQYKVLVQLNMR